MKYSQSRKKAQKVHARSFTDGVIGVSDEVNNELAGASS